MASAKSTSSTGWPSVGSVVGTNCQRLRLEARLTQDELVARLQRLGLRWKRSNLSALEGGDRARPSLAELVLLAVALDRPLAELLSGSGQVELGSDVPAMGLRDLRSFITGGPTPRQLQGRLGDSAKGNPEDLPSQAERDMARRLDVPATWVLEAAEGLWGRTLTEERDRRVEAMDDTDGENRRTRRASVTKQLEVAVKKIVERRDLGYEYE